ncbi:MAG: HAD-IA family hydrolase [Rhizobiaceae bacterium]
MTSPTIVFDLDGTLADTIHDLIPALNRTTEVCGLDPIAISDVGHVVGHGAKAMIKKAFTFHNRELPDDMLDELFANFLLDYEENICVDTVLFDGVLDSLSAFEQDGWNLAVCTNKSEGLAIKLLKKLEIFDRFLAVTGGDTFAIRKPDPAHIIKTIEMAGGRAGAAIMVGDSSTDINGAKSGNIPVVAVNFGYADTPVEELSPDRIISHYKELKDAVVGLI